MKRMLVLAPVALAAACVDTKPDVATGTQSIKVTLVAPQNPGSSDNPIDPSNNQVTVNLAAYGADGQPDTSYTNDVQVYAQFLGTLTPQLGTSPLAVFHIENGVAMNQQVTLPPVFGPTTVWVSDDESQNPTYATGTSPILWYRDPYIRDIQTPASETALNALSDSPLENKQVSVDASRHGANGRLVVTSVFAQGYTVSDVLCQDANGTPPCTAEAYDHIEVFSFSAARDQNFNLIEEGQTIDGFAGGISEFNGLTEVGFPQTFATGHDVNKAREPAPVVLDPATWFGPLSAGNGQIQFERNEAAPIEVDNAVMCPLDADYDTYKQWKVAPGGDCSVKSRLINLITAGVISDLDPATIPVGTVIPKIIGVLRPVEIGSFNVWIIYPRSSADVTLP